MHQSATESLHPSGLRESCWGVMVAQYILAL